MNLTPELRRIAAEIRGHAEDMGLDVFETLFEILDFDHLNEVAAYGGFPTRYPHWRFGMSYERLAKGYAFGLEKIYELVVNNDPCWAYLMASNSLVDQKMVIAHVYGHCDFFKNNVWFSKTQRKMMDTMANHATKVRKFIDRHGLDPVERFLDRALSLENLVDPWAPYSEKPAAPAGPAAGTEEPPPASPRKIASKDYMEGFINPPEFIERQKKKLEADAEKRRRFPPEPDRDVLAFLIEHAPLERWEREVLAIVQDEARYFAPQAMTKIMNEGWATYWHRRIMTERCLTDAEVIDYAEVMSGTLGGRGLNPYKLGLELYLDIERRWNTGRFGLEYERCDDAAVREAWDRKLGRGREKIFEVRKVHSDVTFIDEFLTEEFCHEQKLFLYRWNPRTQRREIADRDFRAVKEQLLRSLTNGGNPVIHITDANFRNRGELYLMHRFDGSELRQDWARETLRNIQALWKRPVHLETREGGRAKVLTTDGRSDSVSEP